MMRAVISLVFLTALLVGPAVLAQQRADVEDEVRQIASQLRCPVCQNLSVADSPSELARQMRDVIREQLEAGKTREDIQAYFVSRYGEWVLLSPKPRGLNLLIYVGPFLALVGGLTWAIRVVRRWTRQSGPRERPTVDPALLARVRQEAAREDLGEAHEGSPLMQKRSRLYGALRELEFDYRSGKLSAEDYEATRANYEADAASVLAGLEAPEAKRRPTPKLQTRASSGPRRQTSRRWRLALGMAFLLVFGGALGIFLAQSLKPRFSDQDSITGDFLTGTGPGGVSPDSAISSMPAGDGAGSDLASLLRAGEETYHRGEWQLAMEAFKRALGKDPGNPVALTHIGMILTEGGHFDRALAAFDQALVRDPGYFPALFAKGIVLAEGKQDYAGALKSWEQIGTANLPPADADRLRRLMDEARTKMSGGATARASDVAPGSEISGTVEVAPGLRRKVPRAGALFLIARKGPGPPLAVRRFTNPTFPLTFVLGPQDRMVGDAPFAGEVTLIARLKRDGIAGPPGPGDLEGRVPTPVPVGRRQVKIILDRAY